MFKKITHVFAFVGAAVMGFVASPAGQAVVHQYPIVSAVLGMAGAIIAVYHAPKQ